MRKHLKTAIAAVLALALCLSFAGCYSENKTWAAKSGDNTLPIGGYIYYLSGSYAEAAEKVSTEEEVLKATVDGQSAESWIREDALNGVRSYFYILNKFDSLGLSLTEEELSSAKSSTDTLWNYNRELLEGWGIAKESFNQVYAVYDTKYGKVFSAMYAPDGELAVSDEELESYFTENYSDYEYFYASLTTTDDDGNSVNLTDEEKSKLKTELEGYVDKINLGDMTTEEAAQAYADEHSGASNYYRPSSAVQRENMTEAIRDAIDGVGDNEAAIAETSTSFYVVRKLPIADKFAEVKDDSTQRDNIVYAMKGEEFADYVEEQAKAMEGIQFNDSAMNSVSIKKIVSDTNKMGTSEAESSEEGE